MANPERASNPEEEEVRVGKVVYNESLGYYIQPLADQQAVVGFPDSDHHQLPDGLKVGDFVTFSLDEDRCNAKEFRSVMKEE